MILKEALDSGYCNLEDDIDFDDTPQGEKIACLKLEIERLNNIINELKKGIENMWVDNTGEDIWEYEEEYLYRKEFLDKIQELKGSDKE